MIFGQHLDSDFGERVYPDMLESLELFVSTHFSREEGCMLRYSCPVAGENADAHEKFRIMLADFQKKFRERGYSSVDSMLLVDTIDRWLTSHICKIDINLKPCLS